MVVSKHVLETLPIPIPQTVPKTIPKRAKGKLVLRKLERENRNEKEIN